jgi:CubicO group peptidase (beta-lactamase class C family)
MVVRRLGRVAERAFPIWSMSKPVKIVAMMRVLLDQDKYAVDEPVTNHLPEFTNLMGRPEDDDL